MKVSVVLEYDAIDFSYVIIAIRLKYNNVYAMCTIEFIFLDPLIPTITINDILKSFNTSLDTSSINHNIEPYQLANELLNYSIKTISNQAFSNHKYV